MERIYIVTGALGHLGSTVVEKLLELKQKVRIFDLNSKREVKYNENVEIIYGDVTKLDSLEKLFKGLDDYEKIVIHCAGIVSITSKYNQKVYDVNVTGTKNIANICLKKKVKKLIYVSSVHAIPEGKKGNIITEIKDFSPNNVVGLYAKTKAEATKYVLNYVKKGLDVSVIHPSGIIGPNDYNKGHTTQLLIDYMKRKLTAGVSGGYDFVDVRDVADAIIKCIDKGKKGKCYIISNKYYNIKDLLEIFHEVTGKKRVKTFIPLWFAKLTAPLAEVYYKILKQKPLYTAYSLYTLQSNSAFSHSLATKELDYHPRDMKLTINDTVEWLIKEKMV